MTEVDYKFTRSSSTLNCRLLADGITRYLLTVDTPQGPYALSMKSPELHEVDRTQKMYDILPFRIGGETYPSRMSPLASTFPSWLFMKSLETKGDLKGTGSMTIGGFRCDGLSLHEKSIAGDFTYDMWVDPNGWIRKFVQTVHDLRGPIVTTWVVDHYVPRRFIDRDFNLDIPEGFVPYALPRAEQLLGVGEPFPTQGWKTRAGKPYDLGSARNGHRLLVAILDAEGPSNRSLSAIKQIRAKLPVVIIATDPAQKAGTVLDAGGLKRAQPEWAPCFALIGTDGKIAKLWMGFDPSQAKAFVTDVLGS